MFLTTQRLLLRELAPSDLDIVIDHFCDPEASRYVLSGQTDPSRLRWMAIAAYAAARQNLRDYFVLAIERISDRAMMGICALARAGPGSRGARLGWNVGREYWGNGYTTEAARALVAFGFEEQRVRRIIADCFAENAASIRVMEKIGMRRQPKGLLMRLAMAMEFMERRPIVRYALTDSQWASR
jgi:RimJ/RimL family protein N-acetyltransferase